MTRGDAAGKLEALARRLGEIGQAELAEEAAAIGAALRGSPAEPRGGLMTTGEAAALLGIASVNTIKRWARQGLLEGYQRGGRVLVSRPSVERMLGAPALAAERAYGQELDEALAPFDAEERPLPPLPWSGRKPWTKGVGPGS